MAELSPCTPLSPSVVPTDLSPCFVLLRALAPPCRYAILAANVLPKGFVDARAATEKLMDAIKLDEGEYRLGFTKVRHFRVPPYSSQSPTCPSCVSLAPVFPLDGPSHAFLSDFLRIFEIA